VLSVTGGNCRHFEPVSLVIKKKDTGRLRWFGYVEYRNDTSWMKLCVMMEVDGTRSMAHTKKTWWDCLKEDMKSFPVPKCGRAD